MKGVTLEFFTQTDSKGREPTMFTQKNIYIYIFKVGDTTEL